MELFFAAGDGHGGENRPTSPQQAGVQQQDEEADEVRQPDEVRREQLVGTSLDEVVNRQGMLASTPVRDPFLEGESLGQSEGEGRLAEVFKPPADVTFQGSFDEAKMAARELGRWLLANIQQEENFDSSRLNRDTWQHEHVKELLKGSFIFFQRYAKDIEGGKLCTYYGLSEPSLPASMLIDPVTGALIKRFDGFFTPEHFLEHALPFLESAPVEPHHEAEGKEEEKNKEPEGGAQEQERSEEDIAEEARKKLNGEPPQGAEGSCRVAFKLPDGSRTHRSFWRHDPVSQLALFVQSYAPHYAKGGGLRLSHASPNSPTLDDESISIEDAKAPNSMLLVTPLPRE